MQQSPSQPGRNPINIGKQNTRRCPRRVAKSESLLRESSVRGWVKMTSNYSQCAGLPRFGTGRISWRWNICPGNGKVQGPVKFRTRELAVEACMYESNDGIEHRSKGCLAEEQRQDGPVINRCRTQPAPLLEPASAARQRWGRFFWRS
jgi:hypothetical protein